MSLKALDPVAQPRHGLREGEQQPRLTAEQIAALPALCGPRELAAIWGITRSQFYRLNRQHLFDKFKLTPAVGPRCFSGVLLARYLSGDPVYAPTFGRKRSA